MKNIDELLNKMLINPDLPLEELREYCETADDLQLVYEEYNKLVKRKFDEAQGIYRFIDLYRQAEYLKSINYTFNPLEKAYLIYHSRRTDLREKHEAWQKLLSLPDMLCKYRGLDKKDSEINLHTLISGYMSYQNDILDRLSLKKESTYYYSGYVDFEKRDEQVENTIREFLAQKVYTDNFVKIIELRTLPYNGDDCTIYVTNSDDKITEVMAHERTEAAKAFDRLHVSLPISGEQTHITKEDVDRYMEELWEVLEALK